MSYLIYGLRPSNVSSRLPVVLPQVDDILEEESDSAAISFVVAKLLNFAEVVFERSIPLQRNKL